jgi:hypothetical protein
MRILHPRRVLLDAGALREAEQNPRGRVWALCEAETAEGRRPLLPHVVLAQMWRGGAGKQAGLARVVKMCEPVEFDGLAARRAGVLLGLSGTSDVVDAAVVLGAAEAGASVWTSDPDDIRHLADSMKVDLEIVTV